MNFGSHTDAVVGIATRLVNTVTPGQAQGRPYTPPTGAPLAAALGAALSSSPGPHPRPSADEAASLCTLGVELRVIYELVDRADLDSAAEQVNVLLGRYGAAPTLSRHDDEPWHLHFHGSPRRDPTGWGGGTAVALATVLGSAYADRLGVCAANGCDRVFVDVTRNATQRFCGTSCQNRTKAAAHRARNRHSTG